MGSRSAQLLYTINCMPGFTFGLASWPSGKDPRHAVKKPTWRWFDCKKSRVALRILNHGLEQLKPTKGTKGHYQPSTRLREIMLQLKNSELDFHVELSIPKVSALVTMA